MSWLGNILDFLPHDGYDSTADAAKAFFMPMAFASEKNLKSVQDTNAANRQLAEFTNQANIEQWRRENAYNDPSNVMQRLRSAGLSPGLMYGQGAGQLSSAPSPQLVGSRDMPASYQMDDLLQKMLLRAQIDKTKAETEKTRTDADLNNVRIDYTKGQIEVGKSVVLYNQAMSDFTRTQKANVEADTKLLGKRLDALDQDIAESRQRVQSMQIDDQIKFLRDARQSMIDNKIVERMSKEMEWDEKKTTAYLSLVNAQINGINADISYKHCLEGLTEEQKNEVINRARNWELQNDRLSWQNSIDEDYYKTEKELQIALGVADAMNTLNESVDKTKDVFGHGVERKTEKKLKKIISN